MSQPKIVHHISTSWENVPSPFCCDVIDASLGISEGLGLLPPLTGEGLSSRIAFCKTGAEPSYSRFALSVNFGMPEDGNATDSALQSLRKSYLCTRVADKSGLPFLCDASHYELSLSSILRLITLDTTLRTFR